MVRISAAIVSIVLIALLAWALTDSPGAQYYVRPTTGETAGGPSDSPAAKSRGDLRARTELQEWRGRTAAAAPAPREQASGAPAASNARASDPSKLVRGWVDERGADWNMLRAPQRYQGVVNIPSER